MDDSQQDSRSDRLTRHAAEVRTLVVLGGNGDLAARLLLPGLGRLLSAGAAPELRLVGVGRGDWSDERWRDTVRSSFARVDASGPAVERILRESTFHDLDVTDPEQLRSLLDTCGGPFGLFFALPPAVTARACRALQQIDLDRDTRLVLEKPFGTDLASAQELNAILADLVPEHHVHRVDHFLGKATVLNVLGLRFANRLFEPVWNNEHIERVDIVFDETLGLEGRAGYYDTAGALRDMVQSHLLQVMAFVTMEAPPSLHERELRDRTADVLRVTRLAGAPAEASRRARWTAGRVQGRDLPAYVDEDGVDPDRATETLAEVDLVIDTWRWSGVPFRLRSGKGLGEKRREIVITFKRVPQLPRGLSGSREPARLRIGLGPDRLVLDLDVNGPGASPFVLERASLETELEQGQLTAYGEVLAGVLHGDPTLSVRGDTAVECWRIVNPVLAAWADDEVPLQEYAAGSSGPDDWTQAP